MRSSLPKGGGEQAEYNRGAVGLHAGPLKSFREEFNGQIQREVICSASRRNCCLSYQERRGRHKDRQAKRQDDGFSSKSRQQGTKEPALEKKFATGIQYRTVWRSQ